MISESRASLDTAEEALSILQDRMDSQRVADDLLRKALERRNRSLNDCQVWSLLIDREICLEEVRTAIPVVPALQRFLEYLEHTHQSSPHHRQHAG